MNTLSQIFFENSLLYKDKKLFGFKKGGEWHHVSWNKASDLVQNLSVGLREIGIKKNDIVAIVLDNGVKFISSFFSVINSCISAPLNPNYSEREFNFYYSDLKPKVLVTDMKDDHASVKVAKKRKIKIINLKKYLFETSKKSVAEYMKTNNTPLLKDNALILHTSGTTSRPKIVPLSNKNIFASSINISSSLELTEKDHCLNIMPLFHIHGLIAILASSMKVGASVCASGGFNALKFLELAKSEKITWYSGVPTMHQAILMRADKNLELAKNLKLRFLRSSSASLPPTVFEKLNSVFECPVIEAYGMTEATHQMTSNPLPPYKQKPGFVGIPAGPEVCIMNKDDKVLNQGKEGEVCIKGSNVTLGYENNPEENKKSFSNGWFRTGDQGYFDKDGYLKISGRLKEIINKGGEKISPLEVDNILMDHPLIEQAVCFGYEDKMLGEEIAAAIIIKEGQNCSETDIKNYAEKKLAKFKIPKKIFFVNEIPKGATGKLQRNVLAKNFGLNN